MLQLFSFKASAMSSLLTRVAPFIVVLLVQPVSGEMPPPQTTSTEPKKTPSGVFVLDAEARKTETSRKYSSDKEDMSAVLVSSKAQLSLFSPNVSTSGETSSPADSRTLGFNAAVLAVDGGSISISGGSIVSTGSGATAAQAIGAETKIALSGTKIVTSGDGAHGAIAADGANLSLTEADIEVAAAEAAGVTADSGGVVTAVGCVAVTTGPRSPALNARGVLTAAGGTYKALLSEGAKVEPGARLSLRNSSLTASRLCGIWLSSKQAAAQAPAVPAMLSIEGGALNATEGPAFLVTNTDAQISLTNVSISTASGVLATAAVGEWGEKGANGGRASITARQQILTGDIVCDDISSLALALEDKSTLTGKITGASLTLDSSSTWTVTGASTLGEFSTAANTAGGTIPNVRGNGHTVRYDVRKPANQWLNGKTYKLSDGGTLEPAP